MSDDWEGTTGLEGERHAILACMERILRTNDHVRIHGFVLRAYEKNGVWMRWDAYCDCDNDECKYTSSGSTAKEAVLVFPAVSP